MATASGDIVLRDLFGGYTEWDGQLFGIKVFPLPPGAGIPTSRFVKRFAGCWRQQCKTATKTFGIREIKIANDNADGKGSCLRLFDPISRSTGTFTYSAFFPTRNREIQVYTRHWDLVNAPLTAAHFVIVLAGPNRERTVSTALDLRPRCPASRPPSPPPSPPG